MWPSAMAARPTTEDQMAFGSEVTWGDLALLALAVVALQVGCTLALIRRHRRAAAKMRARVRKAADVMTAEDMRRLEDAQPKPTGWIRGGHDYLERVRLEAGARKAGEELPRLPDCIFEGFRRCAMVPRPLKEWLSIFLANWITPSEYWTTIVPELERRGLILGAPPSGD